MAAAAGGKKRITQATFDDAVRDNVRVFGMEVAEAVADAEAQFTAMGVELDNLVRDGSTLAAPPSAPASDVGAAAPAAGEVVAPAPAPSHPVLAAAATLSAAAKSAAAFPATSEGHDAVVAACKTLVDETARDVATRAIAGSNYAVQNLCGIVRLALAAPEPRPLATAAAAFDALKALCVGHAENRAAASISLCRAIVDVANDEGLPLPLRRSSLSVGALMCVKREEVKVEFFEAGATKALHDNLTLPSRCGHGGLVKDSCMLLARMLTDDDYSVQASKAYNYARVVAGDGVIPALLDALKAHNGDPATAAEIFAAIKAVTVNDEICKEIERLGGVGVVTECLSVHVLEGVVLPDGAAAATPATPSAGEATPSAVFGMAAPSPTIAMPGGAATATAAGTATGASDAGAGTAVGMGSGSGTAATTPAADAAGGAAGAGAGAGGGAGAAAATLAAPSPIATPAVDVAIARRERMIRCGMSVLRSVANSDSLKVRMCAEDARPMHLMLQAMITCASSPAVMDQTIAALGNLCLRLPDNAARVTAADGIGLIAAAMTRHPTSAGVQRSGCLAVRNLVVRSKERVAAAFEAGLELLLQQAYVRHEVCRDVAYACLRDMGCEYAETTLGREAAERAVRAQAAGSVAAR